MESKSSGDGDTQGSEQTPEAGKKNGKKESRSLLSSGKRIWAKLGLDTGTVLMMLKAAVPQTIAVAMYQSPVVAAQYSTLGYLVAIASVLGFAIMPRAKFFQTMLFNVLGICLGSAVALFAIWTSVKARQNSTPDGVPLQGYNSSASAVCAIWLFFQVYLVNSLRSARAQLRFPTIIYSIFVNVSMTYAPEFPDMTTGISFIKMLLYAFLTGFGLATGVSLFFIPVTQRSVVFKEFTGYLQALRHIIKTQADYASSLEDVNMFRGVATNGQDETTKSHRSRKKENKGYKTFTATPEAVALESAVDSLKALHGKLSTDVVFAKREVAYGKLGPHDLSELFKSLRKLFIPLLGMSSLADIFSRVARAQGWGKQDEDLSQAERKAVDDWQDIMKTTRQPMDEVGGAIDKALEHVLLRLQLIKPPKKQKKNLDEESMDNSPQPPQPGSDEFAGWFDQKTKDFYDSRTVTLRRWCEQKNVALPHDSFETNFNWHKDGEAKDATGATNDQRQLYLVLYIEYLLYKASRRALELVAFADSKVSDGTMSSNRIIVPGYARLKKWLRAVFSADEDIETTSQTVAMDGSQDIYLGEAFTKRKDPEHLPPQNSFEVAGNYIRVIPRLMRSDHSVFGFRVACATLSIGIVAYLKDTYTFFIEQRLVWALIMVTISMTRTSGQSFFNFTLRVFGTLCAMIASYLIYYIPDGNTAGIIVFLYIWEVLCFYIVLKMPRFVVVGIISAVTAILIIGYELQVRVLGVKAAESSGQPAYGINILAPYRLACVAGGLAVAWIWTIFPFPVTEHSELRKDLGAAIYLLANFYAVVHETVGSRARGDEGDPAKKASPAALLEKARHKVFSKQLLLIANLKSYAEFSKWEVALGGRFPRETYEILIRCIESVSNYSSLIAFASESFRLEEASTSQWHRDFRRLIEQLAATSHDITSRLCLLSSAMAEGTPLPPYLNDLEPYRLTEKITKIDPDILSVQHIAEPGYAAFAVIQIAGRSIFSDLNNLTQHVKALVGELDFSYHFISSSSEPDLSFDSQSAKNKQS